MIFKRQEYLEKIISEKHTNRVKIITGIRRCGKSFLLNHIFYNHLIASGVKEDHIIRLSFDFLEHIMMVSKNKNNPKLSLVGVLNYLRSFYERDNEMYYIIIDEVQELNNFYLLLNNLLDKKNVDVYVTGSNSKLLSKDIATQFSGRGLEIHIQPLSFTEFYEQNKDKGYNYCFNQYINFGGLPEVVNEENEFKKIEKLKSIVRDTYLKDIVERNKVRHPEELEQLFNYLFLNTGSLTNIKKIANTLKTKNKTNISKPTIYRYINYFCDSFLLNKVSRFSYQRNKMLGNLFKVYACDLGLMLAFNQNNNQDLGKKFETIVYNELRFKGYSDIKTVEIETRVLNKKGQSVIANLEIDFLATYINRKVYIQVSWDCIEDNVYIREVKPFKYIKNEIAPRILITRVLNENRDLESFSSKQISFNDFIQENNFFKGQ